MAGIKYRENKLEWSLLDYEAMEEVIKVLMYGAIKYSPDNYKAGLNRFDLLDAIQRHLAEVMKDNELDEETGASHMAHIVCNCLFYIHNFKHQKFMDDVR